MQSHPRRPLPGQVVVQTRSEYKHCLPSRLPGSSTSREIVGVVQNGYYAAVEVLIDTCKVGDVDVLGREVQPGGDELA